MQVVSSYGAEIKNKNIPIRHTLALYREAVRCLTEIYETVWTELSMIDQIKRRFNEAEHLVHETKKNHARFDFDARFPKMPSYLRRAAIQHALGSVSSYHTRLEQWKNGAISGKPKLVYENHAMPVFYRNVMYKPGEESEDAACLKLYDGHDWKWFRAVCFIRIWSTCAGTGPEKSLLLRFWKNDIRNIISAFLIQKKLHYQKHL